MKTVFLVWFAFAILLFAGCSKDEMNVVPANTTTAQIEKSKGFLRFDLVKQESVMVDDLSNTSSMPLEYRASNNMSTNGHFSPVEDWVVTFSGMQNNSGVHGSALISGPPVRFQMSTACLAFEGNEAVYGGLITQIFYQDEEIFGFVEPGMYCAFKIKDNGEGQNAPKDQVGYNLWFWWDDLPCQYLPPSSEDWGIMLDVVGHGDAIQVK